MNVADISTRTVARLLHSRDAVALNLDERAGAHFLAAASPGTTWSRRNRRSVREARETIATISGVVGVGDTAEPVLLRKKYCRLSTAGHRASNWSHTVSSPHALRTSLALVADLLRLLALWRRADRRPLHH